MASEQAWSLLTLALEQGRLTSATHGMELQNATRDYAATVARLAAKPAAVNAADSRTWPFDKLRREAPGVLEKMSREEPERYNALRALGVAEIKNKAAKKSPHR